MIQELYILVSDLVWYTINNYRRLKILVVWGKILSLEYEFIEFTIQHLSLIYFCISEIFKTSD